MTHRPTMALGRRDFDYLPYCWFGRPLRIESLCFGALASIAAQFTQSDCDGFILKIPNLGFVGTLESFANEVEGANPGRSLWLDVGKHIPAFGNLGRLSPNVEIVASHPACLVAAAQAGASQLLFEAHTDKDLTLLEKCPYAGVILSDQIATHQNIRKFGTSKTIAARLRNTSPARLAWLAKERVDAIIVE